MADNLTKVMKELYGSGWDSFSDHSKLLLKRKWIRENPEEAKKHMTWKKWKELKAYAAKKGVDLE